MLETELILLISLPVTFTEKKNAFMAGFTERVFQPRAGPLKIRTSDFLLFGRAPFITRSRCLSYSVHCCLWYSMNKSNAAYCVMIINETPKIYTFSFSRTVCLSPRNYGSYIALYIQSGKRVDRVDHKCKGMEWARVETVIIFMAI